MKLFRDLKTRCFMIGQLVFKAGRCCAISVVLLFQMSCGQSGQEHQKHSEKLPEVTLDDGKRWIANPETTDGIRAMVHSIEQFQEDQQTDYSVLKESLQGFYSTILKKCTMKGEAHNQLHHYLVPLNQEIDNLSGENIESVYVYLKTYDDYFE